MGGYLAIAAVVDRFGDKIIRNPKLNRNPALRAWNRTQANTAAGSQVRSHAVDRGRGRRTFEYTGLPLKEAHGEFNLTAEEFAEVGAEIVRSLDFYNVPEREKQELVDAYRASMSDVVTE